MIRRRGCVSLVIQPEIDRRPKPGDFWIVMRRLETEDKPEPRWQAVLGLLAGGGIYMALPPALTVGPRWLLLLVISIMLVPTVVSHRMGRHSLNHFLGILINSVITAAGIVSLGLLVAALPGRKEDPRALLVSAAALWSSNVLVFALWYWRLDGGGPTVRSRSRRHGSRAFLFPQMQIDQAERAAVGVDDWSPSFVDYLFVAFNTSAAFSPTDTPVLAVWAKLLNMVQALISLTIVALLVSRAVGVL
jgi:hypothetical protein